MAAVAEIVAALAEIAPLSKAAAWDAVGLQVGDPDAEAERLAVCHEVTDEVVTAAIDDAIDLVVTYHSLLFRPVRSFVAGATPSGRALRLARGGVAVAAVHTAFDVAAGGAADALAAALGLEDASGFAPMWGDDAVKVVTFVPEEAADDVEKAMAAAGAGEIGAYSGCSFRLAGTGSFFPGSGALPTVGTPGRKNRAAEIRLEMIAPAAVRDRVVAALVAAHPYEEPAYDVLASSSNAAMVGRRGSIAPTTVADLTSAVGRALRTRARHTGPPERTVSSVAVVPGSGGSFLAQASDVADVIVTGDVSHHEARQAIGRGLAVIDAGHVPTERPGLDALYAAAARIVPGAVRLDIDPHPWKEA